ncbi:NAD-dependent epimerase/dehydratase family protein [Haloferax larsenii]|uniref:UDP-glucose 4-epimerase n=1 Tax=Haloferax larsenii TaxID=302484 RepID=A0A1H7PSG3_HALLR|nr:NAD-dependent epimerase/dehydratase family protein [Haloferax larsenii]SEL38760.1 UDP-glucose 4-epimerase [Haloferax larsenii]
MRILVTGGAGFIGGHLAEAFAREGHDVVVVDNFTPYYDLGIKHHNVDVARQAASESGGSYELVVGDVRNAELMEKLVRDSDIVYHQAAQAGVRSSVDEPLRVNEINVRGTLNVLEAARDADLERVVFASSSSVYGTPEYLPYDESHPTYPVSPYGASKLAAESYVSTYNEVYELPTVSLRYFTVYGPRMRPNMAISNFVSRCANGEPPVIYGDGRQTRDFTYVDDIITANLRLLDTDAADGEVMNIGSTDNISVLDLAEAVRDRVAPSMQIEYDERAPGDAEHTHAAVSKAADLIDYEPRTSIREGVSAFVDWYDANRDWYEPLVRSSMGAADAASAQSND